MPKLMVLYPPPADVTTFERRYHSEHAPMVVQNIPGLKKFLAAQVLGTPAGAAPYQRAPNCTLTRSNYCRLQWPHQAARLQWPTPWRSLLVVRLWS
jgi:uncharacterized protein (TIGR02118 family)